MKCRFCRKEAKVNLEYAKLSLCKNCFINFFQRRVERTVKEYKMFREEDVVGIAVSGGKDSIGLLHALKQAFPKQEFKILHINLGIKGYSNLCEDMVKKIGREFGIEPIIYNIKKEEGFTIEDFKKTLYKKEICSACGTIKRFLFNHLSFQNDIDVLATGHNLDDMVNNLFSSFLNGDFPQLVRIKPVLLPTHPKLKKKVKPLFRIPEKEIFYYVKFNSLPFVKTFCPYKVEKRIIKDDKMKYQLLSSFMKLIPLIEDKIPKPKLRECKICGYPSLNEICARCKRVSLVKDKV